MPSAEENNIQSDPKSDAENENKNENATDPFWVKCYDEFADDTVINQHNGTNTKMLFWINCRCTLRLN